MSLNWSKRLTGLLGKFIFSASVFCLLRSFASTLLALILIKCVKVYYRNEIDCPIHNLSSDINVPLYFAH